MGKKYTQEEIIIKTGGRFKLASILEKRYKELLFGSRPLVETESTDVLDILIEEVMEDKVELILEADALAAAAAALKSEGDSVADAERAAELSAREAILGKADEATEDSEAGEEDAEDFDADEDDAEDFDEDDEDDEDEEDDDEDVEEEEFEEEEEDDS